MTYPDWIAEQLAYYEAELARLEQEEDQTSEQYQARRADLLQCKKMLDELAEPPIEEDSA